ncbi:MAG: hypothetical protein ACLFQM_10390 [Fidelibacterota bacterium]
MTQLKYKLILVLFLISGLYAGQNSPRAETDCLKSFKQNCWSEDDRWLGYDKLKHFSSSMFLFITDYYYQAKYMDYSHQANIRNSYVLSISFGLGKEILDYSGKNRYFSIKDIIIDISGVVAGHIIVNNIK